MATIGPSAPPARPRSAPSSGPPPSAVPVDVARAIERLRVSATIQTERVQALCDGVHLAAEQVQDVRLRLAEVGTATASEAMFEVLLTLCLESTFAGKALAGAGRAVFKGIIRLRRGAEELAGATDPAVVKRVVDRVTRDFDPAAAMADHNRFAASLAKVSGDTEQNLAAMMKAAREAISKKPMPIRMANTDTPGVAILGAVYSYASSQRTSISVSHAATENSLLAGLMNADDVHRLVASEGTGSSLDDHRARYKLLFEAAIWAKLYGFDRRAEQLASAVSSGRLSASNASLNYLNKLVVYWFDRLGPSIDDWVGEGAERRIQPLTLFTSLPHPAKKVAYLRQYFLSLGLRWSRGPESLVPG